MNKYPNRAILIWVALGLLAYVLLPWYAYADAPWYATWHQIFAASDTASGLLQATSHSRVWLMIGALGLIAAGATYFMRPGRNQGAVLIASAGAGSLGVVGAGFLIGSKGWRFDWMNSSFGELAINQLGMGIGAFVALVALVVLFAFGIARRGMFRGDLFVAASVLCCAALLVVFIAYPVSKTLQAAFVTEEGVLSVSAFFSRLGNDRTWGLGCLSGNVSCGVAWNTLFLALLTATSTTILGTMMALMAERAAGPKLQTPLRVLAMLPIITPPFVVGLGLILLFGRAGLANQFLEWAFGIPPTRWFYGLFGIWLAQTFAFTPIAFMIMRGVVQGVAPSLEEAAQTLRADRSKTFFTITLPLLKPGLANAFLVGFIESIADFGNPIVVGGSYSVLSTDIFFAIVGAQYDQGKAASLAWILTLFALAVFAIQRGLLGKQNYTTVTGKGDSGLPIPLSDGVRRTVKCFVCPWLAFTVIIYVFAFIGGFVQTWGR
ncbi:MAG: ABC transporter permease, partial [Brachymonas sp.]